MDSPTPPPLSPAPVKKGLSTGCIIALVLSIVVFVGLGVFGILAAIAIPNILKVTEKAKAVQTRVYAQSLVIGIKGYNIEYNRMPVSKGESSAVLSEGKWIAALLGTDEELNPRKVAFLEASAKPSKTGGLVSSNGAKAWVDSWGHPFRVLMDTSGDDHVPDPEHLGSTLTASVAVWSAGPDGDYDTWADNIRSWK
jgi:type II secretory pathway pseudopilin PulG